MKNMMMMLMIFFFFFFTLECRQVGLKGKSRLKKYDPEHTRLDGPLTMFLGGPGSVMSRATRTNWMREIIMIGR